MTSALRWLVASLLRFKTRTFMCILGYLWARLPYINELLCLILFAIVVESCLYK